MVLVKIMLTVLLLDPRSLDTFTLAKSVAGHVTSLVIVALLLWLLARHGRALLVWSPIHVGVGALLVAFAVATPFALDPTVALFGTFKRYLGLTQMLDNVALYLAITFLFRDIRSLRLLAGVSIGVAVPVFVYAMIQRFGLDPLRFVQAPTTIPISTLGNPDLVGGFMSMIGITALGFAVLIRGHALMWPRVALVLIGAACVGILFVTGVRSGVLGLGAGWLAAILLALRMPRIGRSRRIGTVAVAVLLAVGVLASPLRTRLDPRVLGSDQAISNRFEIWHAAITAVAERPILGLGPDNFVAAYPSHREESSIVTGNLENSTHDVWLYVATSAGAVGVGAFLLLVVLAVLGGLRLVGEGEIAAFALIPLAAYLGQSLVNVNEIVLDWPFWVSLGVIAGATGRTPRITGPSAPRKAATVGAIALAGAVLISVTTVLPRIVVGEDLLSSEAYAAANRQSEAVPYGRSAVQIDPRRGEDWSSYGVALFGAGEGTAALIAFERAASLQPWQPLSWENLALAWVRLGNGDAAFAAAKLAPVADPYDAVGHSLVASLASAQGDYALAAKEGELAIAYQLTPDPSTYRTTINAYIQLKKLDRAESLGRKAVSLFPDVQFRLQLAAILGDEGKTAEALTLVDQVLAQQPNNTGAQQLRELLLKKS